MAGLVPGLEYHLTIQAPGLQPSRQELVLKPDEVREIGDIRLEWWGKKAVPVPIKKLQSADRSDRELAARQLGELGTDAADAVPALVEKLKRDPRNTVRFSVAEALGKIGPTARAAVPDLIKEWRPYYADSNDAAMLRDMSRTLTVGSCGDVKLRVRRGCATWK